MTDLPRPRLARSLTLHFRGDWGQANEHRICGWIANHVGLNSGPHTRSAIWTGHGMIDSVRAVGRGEVDLAIVVPQQIAPLALDGRGPFAGEPLPGLRAIAVLPQNDWLLCAVDAGLGIRDFDDLRRADGPLTVVTSANDGINSLGFAAHTLLDMAGVTVGGDRAPALDFVEIARPMQCIAAMAEGRGDLLIQEAVYGPAWKRLAETRDLAFLSIPADVLRRMDEAFGWPDAVLPAGYLRGMTGAVATLRFSDYLIVVRDDMPDDLAQLVAWCVTERRADLERQYAHLPGDRSPINHPLDPARMCRTPIPLHPGAAAHFTRHGYLRGARA